MKRPDRIHRLYRIHRGRQRRLEVEFTLLSSRVLELEQALQQVETEKHRETGLLQDRLREGLPTWAWHRHRQYLAGLDERAEETHSELAGAEERRMETRARLVSQHRETESIYRLWEGREKAWRHDLLRRQAKERDAWAAVTRPDGGPALKGGENT